MEKYTQQLVDLKHRKREKIKLELTYRFIIVGCVVCVARKLVKN